MTEILLTTLNAKYIHSAFGLRYLMANLGDLQSRAVIREFTINDQMGEIVAAIVERQPRLKTLFDATIASRTAEMKNRVREHQRLFFGT